MTAVPRGWGGVGWKAAPCEWRVDGRCGRRVESVCGGSVKPVARGRAVGMIDGRTAWRRLGE